MTVVELWSRQEPTTTDLLGAASAGDPRAWEQLVRRFEPLVSATVRSYHLQDADVRDAVQRTWLRLVEKHDTVRNPEALAGWLVTTARRECLHVLNGRRREWPTVDVEYGPGPDGQPDTEQRVVDADTVRRLRGLIELLPARPRAVLAALFDEDPPSYAELARATGLPIGSIGPTRARALQQLSDLFDGPRSAVAGRVG